MTFSPELCKALGATEPVSAANGILFSYLGLTFGDLGAGLLSQAVQRRKAVVAGFIVATAALTVVYLKSVGQSATYWLPDAALYVGMIASAVALAALVPLKECFGRDLDLVEA